MIRAEEFLRAVEPEEPESICELRWRPLREIPKSNNFCFLSARLGWRREEQQLRPPVQREETGILEISL